MKTINKNDITAVVLSGGQSSRMGKQDKGLILLKDKPLISYVVNVIVKNVDSILVSANKNLDLYQKFGTVITDDLENFQGPLAGISKAMQVASTPYLLVLPCDGPFVNETLIERLLESMQKNQTKLCVASDGERMHPTFALIDTSIAPILNQYLDNGERRLGKFFRDNSATEVDFSDQPKMFINLNSPEDLLSTND